MTEKPKPATGLGDGFGNIEVVEYRPHESGQLRGYLSLIVPPLLIHDVKLFETDDGVRFVRLPDREFQKRDGGTGYAPIIELVARHLDRKFQVAAIEARERYLADTQEE